MNTIVLVGARTTLGAEVFTRLVSASGDVHVHILHEGEALESTQRFLDRLQLAPGLDMSQAKLQALDFTEQFAGVSDALLDTLSGESVDVVLDMSAFDAGLNAAEAEHLYGRAVNDIIGLCASNPQARVHVLSSLFIGGDRFGGFTEYDFDFGQNFGCALDQARFRIEGRLRERVDAARLAIYRLPLLLPPTDSSPQVEPVSRFDAVVQAARSWRKRAWGDPRSVVPLAETEHAADFIEKNILNPDAGSGTGVGTFHIVERNRGMKEFVESMVAEGASLSWRPRAIRNWLAGKGNSLADPMQDCTRAVRDDFYALWQADTYRFRRRCAELGIEATDRILDWTGKIGPEFETHGRLIRALRQQVALGLDGVYTLDGHDQRVVDDVSLDYWNIGEGPALVLVPGILGPESVFGLARRLRRDFQVIIADTHDAVRQKGWQNPEARLAREAALLKGLLAQLEIRKVTRLVAFDLAVPVALYHQSRWPTATEGLLMVNAISEPDAELQKPAAWQRWNRSASIMRGIRFWIARHSIYLASKMSGFTSLIQRDLPDVEGRMWRLNRRLAHDRNCFDRTMQAIAEAAAMDAAELTRARAPRALVWACDQRLGSLSHGLKLLANATNDEPVRLIGDAGTDVGEHKPRQLASVIRESLGGTMSRARGGEGKVAGLTPRTRGIRSEDQAVAARSVRSA